MILAHHSQTQPHPKHLSHVAPGIMAAGLYRTGGKHPHHGSNRRRSLLNTSRFRPRNIYNKRATQWIQCCSISGYWLRGTATWMAQGYRNLDAQGRRWIRTPFSQTGPKCLLLQPSTRILHPLPLLLSLKTVPTASSSAHNPTTERAQRNQSLQDHASTSMRKAMALISLAGLTPPPSLFRRQCTCQPQPRIQSSNLAVPSKPQRENPISIARTRPFLD